jgi:flavin-binding protein dodecin
MSVAKVIEISARSPDSFEAAILEGVDRVNNSVDQVTGVWIKDQQAVIKGGKIAEYQVMMKVTFIVSPSQQKAAKAKRK